MNRVISKEELGHLQELTHELSNSVGLVMNHLILTANSKDLADVLDKVGVALELSIRGSDALQRLMWSLGRIAENSKLGTETKEARQEARLLP